MSVPPQPLSRVLHKDEIIPATERMIAGRDALVEHIASTVTPEEATFENAHLPLLKYDNDQSQTFDMIEVLKYASPDADTQAAVEEANKLWAAYSPAPATMEKNSKLAFAAGKRTDGLDAESKRLLEKRIAWFERLGFGGKLSEETRKAYLETNETISALCNEFNRNIRQYDGGHLLFTDDELRGLEASEVEAYEKDSDGKRRVPVMKGQWLTIMASATSPSTRKKFNAVWAARLPENVAIFRKIILLRAENARRMGYKSNADSCLYNRLAKSTEWVEALLSDLAGKMIGPGRELFKDVEALKRRLLEEKSDAVEVDGDPAVQVWEKAYLEKLLAKENRVDYDAIKEYLPFKETTAAILRNLTKYMQLRLDPVTGKDLEGCLWAPNVDVWAVWDEDPEDKGQFIGYLYTDLLDRPNKYKHNQTVEVNSSYLRDDGSRPYPAVILMCCFTPDIIDGCQVLQHKNVITMYHELGHGLQVLFSRTRFSATHGYAVAPEYGEGIGTVMENIGWNKAELQSVGCHYAYTDDAYKQAWMKRHPGQPLPPREMPDELISELINRRPKHRITFYLKQMTEAMFDMGVHNPKSPEDLEQLDETRLFHDLIKKYCFVTPIEPAYQHADFQHLTSGYHAAYYSYIWQVVRVVRGWQQKLTSKCSSNMFGEDMYQSNFAADQTSTEAWSRFRYKLLQYGGSRDQTELLEEFLGRPPTTAALLKSIGIDPGPEK